MAVHQSWKHRWTSRPKRSLASSGKWGLPGAGALSEARLLSQALAQSRPRRRFLTQPSGGDLTRH
jgi:hypothetical protein